MDPAFESILSGSESIVVWRVKQFNLVAVNPTEFGKFYSGDAYLVYRKQKVRDSIFYWIGREASIDERTTLAIKAVELDDALGGVPVQHREKEGYESLEFRRLFPEGVITMSGGYESGLKKAKTEHITRLFKVCGGNAPMLSEVEVGWPSMNHGDTFVLDTGAHIFVWKGSKSSGGEGLAAAKLASRLRNKMGEQIVTVEDGDEQDMTDTEKNVWEVYLKLEDKNQIKEADSTSDRKMSKILSETKLYRCTEEHGNLKTKHVKTGNLSRTDLDGGDSFVLEAGVAGVWVWLGSHSSQVERREAMKIGEMVITEGNLPSHTRLTRVIMNSEPEDFRSLFQSWN